MTRRTIGFLVTWVRTLLVTPPDTCSSRKEAGMGESTFNAQAYKVLIMASARSLISGIGQNCPKTPSISRYQGKRAC